MISSDADQKAQLAYLYRILDLLPGLPPSMQATMHTSCIKTVKRLHLQGALTGAEANNLAARVRDTQRNRQPSRCGLTTGETR